jgi:hypothetical protein
MATNESKPAPQDKEDGVDRALIRWMMFFDPGRATAVHAGTQLGLPPRSEAQKLAILRRTLEERKRLGYTPQQ